MTTLLKKISSAHVFGEITAPAVGELRPIMRVIGHAKEREVKTTTYGDATAFKGDFMATNVKTGEVFRSGVMYLPDVATSLLNNAMDNNDGVVEFGFEVGVIGIKGKKDNEPNKYEYRCRPLVEAIENDPLALLAAKIEQKTLAAPKDEEKPAAKDKK